MQVSQSSNDDWIMAMATSSVAALDLVDTRTAPNGVTIQVYRSSGRPEYATPTAKAAWRQS